MIETIFAKRTKDDFPIIRGCQVNNIDFVRLKEFFDSYGYFIEAGVSYKALELHKSKKFQEVETTGQALNEGQNCFAQFIKDFYKEYEEYRQNPEVDENSF